jgi:hypothetical protein
MTAENFEGLCLVNKDKYAFVATLDGEDWMFYGKQKLGKVEGIPDGQDVFTYLNQESKRPLFFFAQTSGESEAAYFSHGGEILGPYQYPDELKVSPDTEKAYMSKSFYVQDIDSNDVYADGKTIWLLDVNPLTNEPVYHKKEEGESNLYSGHDPILENIDGLIIRLEFSKNRKRMIYLINEGGRKSIYHDEKLIGEDVSVRKFGISPDGSKTFYLDVNKNLDEFLYFNGDEIDQTDLTHAAFSPDSKHFGYISKEGKKYMLNFEGTKVDLGYDRLTTIRGFKFSEDSKYLEVVLEKGTKIISQKYEASKIEIQEKKKLPLQKKF